MIVVFILYNATHFLVSNPPVENRFDGKIQLCHPFCLDGSKYESEHKLAGSRTVRASRLAL